MRLKIFLFLFLFFYWFQKLAFKAVRILFAQIWHLACSLMSVNIIATNEYGKHLFQLVYLLQTT